MGNTKYQNIKNGSYQLLILLLVTRLLEDNVSINSNVVKDVNLIEDVFYY